MPQTPRRFDSTPRTRVADNLNRIVDFIRNWPQMFSVTPPLYLSRGPDGVAIGVAPSVAPATPAVITEGHLIASNQETAKAKKLKFKEGAGEGWSVTGDEFEVHPSPFIGGLWLRGDSLLLEKEPKSGRLVPKHHGRLTIRGVVTERIPRGIPRVVSSGKAEVLRRFRVGNPSVGAKWSNTQIELPIHDMGIGPVDPGVPVGGVPVGVLVMAEWHWDEFQGENAAEEEELGQRGRFYLSGFDCRLEEFDIVEAVPVATILETL